MIHETDRYGTATTSAPLSRGPQPGWMTLNQARDRGFTGEIVFETEPEMRAYLDNGAVYFAERDLSGSLAQRLVETGVLDHGQIERGTVRIGDVEHLGRLFDREPSVDRDAVLVVTELLTDELVAELANDVITTVRSTAYRHHPSGLHRWFATPIETAADLRPGMVSSLEASVLDDLPGLPINGERLVTDQLYIEWDEPVIGGSAVVEEESFVESFDDSALEAMLDEAVAEESAATESMMLAPPAVEEILYLDEIEDFDELIDLGELCDEGTMAVEPELAVDFQSASWPTADVVEYPIGQAFDDGEVDEEFEVVWPSGSIEIIASDDITPPEAVSEASAEPVAATVDNLSMTPIETFDDEIVADVPADVADAVKRAIAALEAATFAPPTVGPIMQPADFDEPAAVIPPASEPAPGFGAFAPPSLDMSAEAMYARMAAEQASAPIEAEAAVDLEPAVDPLLVPLVTPRLADDSLDATPSEVADTEPHPALPTAGVASVVFVDDATPTDEEGGANERSSALRRLIGSLRRKDR